MRPVVAFLQFVSAVVASVRVKIKAVPGNPFKVRVDLSDRPHRDWRVRITASIKMNWTTRLKAIFGKTFRALLVGAALAAFGTSFWVASLKTALLLIVMWILCLALLWCVRVRKYESLLRRPHDKICMRVDGRSQLLDAVPALDEEATEAALEQMRQRVKALWEATSDLPPSGKAAVAATSLRILDGLPEEAEQLDQRQLEFPSNDN
jgi:hypothetical protein